MVNTEEDWAARVALLVLRLQAQRLSRPELYIILPSPEPVDLSRAIETLARMEKPLRCDARETAGLLTIDCHRVTSELELRAIRSNFREWTEWSTVRAGHRTDTATAGDLKAVLRSAHESLQVPVSALLVWARDYFILHAFAVRDPVSSDQAPLIEVTGPAHARIEIIREPPAEDKRS